MRRTITDTIMQNISNLTINLNRGRLCCKARADRGKALLVLDAFEPRYRLLVPFVKLVQYLQQCNTVGDRTDFSLCA